uniref:Uncharacterized protein n=1 Tax=Cacopsylla melanoneura TaxID=428564 RepID=A0A8D8MH58_9HEMI
MAGGNLFILGLFLMSMAVLNYAVEYDTIDWNYVDPATDTNFKIQNFAGKDLCAENNKGLCETDLKDAISKNYFQGQDLRACCEDAPDHKNICWVRRKKTIREKRRTTFELQMWLEGSKSVCRYANHTYDVQIPLFGK